jgi:hypothetical protein
MDHISRQSKVIDAPTFRQFYEVLSNFLYQIQYLNTGKRTIQDRDFLGLLYSLTLQYTDDQKAKFELESLMPAFCILVQSKNEQDLKRFLAGFRCMIEKVGQDKLLSFSDIKCLRAITTGFDK